MKKKDHYRHLESLYYSAPFNKHLSPTLSIKKGTSTLETHLHSQFFHAAKASHGAIIFKTLDDAAYFAAHSLEMEYFLVTVTFHINFIRPVFDETIQSIGTVISQTKNHMVCDSKSYNASKKLVASGTGTFMKSNVKLNTINGYSNLKL